MAVRTMHGFCYSILEFGSGMTPCRCGAQRRRVGRASPTDPADPPPMSLFLSLHNGTIASLAVVVWVVTKEWPRGRCRGTTFPVLSQLDTSNGTVIGKRPQVDPTAHSVVTVPVTAVACVVAVKGRHADRASEVRVELTLCERLDALRFGRHRPVTRPLPIGSSLEVRVLCASSIVDVVLCR